MAATLGAGGCRTTNPGRTDRLDLVASLCLPQYAMAATLDAGGCRTTNPGRTDRVDLLLLLLLLALLLLLLLSFFPRRI